jgi:hypothetical protein
LSLGYADHWDCGELEERMKTRQEVLAEDYARQMEKARIKIQQPVDTLQVSTQEHITTNDAPGISATPASPIKKLITFAADQLDIGHGPIGCWLGIITIVGFELLALPTLITAIADKSGDINAGTACFMLCLAIFTVIFILAEIEIAARASKEKRPW